MNGLGYAAGGSNKKEKFVGEAGGGWCKVMQVEVGGVYILPKWNLNIIFDIYYLPLLWMLDWEFSSEKSLPFLAGTDASSLCAPLQQYPFLHAGPSTLKSCRLSSPWIALDGR